MPDSHAHGIILETFVLVEALGGHDEVSAVRAELDHLEAHLVGSIKEGNLNSGFPDELRVGKMIEMKRDSVDHGNVRIVS
jgi:hypothetical protein